MNIRNFVGGFGQKLRTGIDSIVKNAPRYFETAKREYGKNLDRVRTGINTAHRVASGLAPEYASRIEGAKSRADHLLSKGDEFNRRLANTRLY